MSATSAALDKKNEKEQKVIAESGTLLKPLTLKGHTGLVPSIALTSDGKWGLSGGHDNTLRLWDLNSGTCIRELKGHTGPVQSVALTSDGKLGLSGSQDKTIRLWDLSSGTCIRKLESHSVHSVALTSDGKLGLSGPDKGDSILRLWDLNRGTCVRELEGHRGSVWGVALTPDGKLGLSGGEDTTIRLWDLSSGTCVRKLEGHTSHVNRVALTPDGKWGLSGSHDKTMRLWNLSNGTCVQELKGHKDAVVGVALTPDGKWGLSGGWDSTLRFWNLSSGVCERVINYSTSVYPIASLIRNHYLYALVGLSDGTLQLEHIYDLPELRLAGLEKQLKALRLELESEKQKAKERKEALERRIQEQNKLLHLAEHRWIMMLASNTTALHQAVQSADLPTLTRLFSLLGNSMVIAGPEAVVPAAQLAAASSSIDIKYSKEESEIKQQRDLPIVTTVTVMPQAGGSPSLLSSEVPILPFPKINPDFRGMSFIHLTRFLADKQEIVRQREIICTLKQLKETIQIYLTAPAAKENRRYLRQLYSDVKLLLTLWREGRLDNPNATNELDQEVFTVLKQVCWPEGETRAQCANTALLKRIEEDIHKQKYADYQLWLQKKLMPKEAAELLEQSLIEGLILKGEFHNTEIGRQAASDFIRKYQHSCCAGGEGGDQRPGSELLTPSTTSFLKAKLSEIVNKINPSKSQIQTVLGSLLGRWKKKQLEKEEQDFLEDELMKGWNHLLKQMEHKFDVVARMARFLEEQVQPPTKLNVGSSPTPNLDRKEASDKPSLTAAPARAPTTPAGPAGVSAAPSLLFGAPASSVAPVIPVAPSSSAASPPVASSAGITSANINNSKPAEGGSVSGPLNKQAPTLRVTPK